MNEAWKEIRLVVAALTVLLAGFLVKWIGSGLTLGAVLAMFVGYVGVCLIGAWIWITLSRGRG